MGTFQLILKQMRQLALGTWLTLLSVLLGVALAISILLLRDAGQALFGHTEFGYDVILGVAQGSPTQLVMNTVYHIDRSPGNMPYWVYEQANAQNRPPRGSKEFVAGVGILVSIYNSVSARTREIAILRALGATRGRVLTLICAKAGLIGFVGAMIGLLVGHALGAVASAYLNNTVGQGFNWLAARPAEWVYMAIVIVIALLAGLVPAMKAYKTPVATNLVAA